MNSKKRSKVVTTEWFAFQIEKSDSGCWNWKRYRDPNGYGKLSSFNRPHLAHRVAWELWRGPIPQGLCVCHHCDNPSCVNPDHLFVGTIKDNNNDRKSKGRSRPSGVFGVRHGMHVLNDEIALEIFRMSGKQRDIARKFVISQAHVWRIKNKLSWKHIHLNTKTL